MHASSVSIAQHTLYYVVHNITSQHDPSIPASRCSTAICEQACEQIKSMRTGTPAHSASLTYHHHPRIMQKPGIPAQQMQRTGTRERACGSGTGTRTTPRNLAA